jgi:BirA family biotin operon repressor/biotin-[acetyl-CoA-carboxylase] ligase
MNKLTEGRIEAALRTQIFGCNLIVLPRTSSTNDVAKDLAARRAPEGTVVIADEQTAGRGRMGRRWSAPSGDCLLCSILFRPDLPPARIQWLTTLCALATADAVEELAGLWVWLKWPNDLIVESSISGAQSPGWRKLGGILTEMEVVAQQVEFVVVGIGVNVNVSPEVLPTLAPDATSILTETQLSVDRAALLAALLAGVERRYRALRAGEDVRQEWMARLATLGRPVEATTPKGVLTGVAESVGEDGALLLRTPDGELHRLLAGDVTLTSP